MVCFIFQGGFGGVLPDESEFGKGFERYGRVGGGPYPEKGSGNYLSVMDDRKTL